MPRRQMFAANMASRYSVRAANLALITQIIVHLPIAINPTAVRPCFTDEFDLSVIFLRPIAERRLLPRIVSAWVNTQTTAHHPNGKLATMLSNKRVSHSFGIAL